MTTSSHPKIACESVTSKKCYTCHFFADRKITESLFMLQIWDFRYLIDILFRLPVHIIIILQNPCITH